MKNFLTSMLFISLLNFSFAQELETSSPVDEIVLFTLVEGDLRYEIRLFQNKNIKTYEIKNGEITYLGKFMNLMEVERSEPYKTLLTNERNATKTFVTDGYLGNDFYEIYIHNLFNTKKEKPIFVEVLKVEDKKSEVVSKYEKESDFNESPFAPLLRRD
ncbi:hypothetical protein [Moheibacter sediminis]|nr:hypothetical protein [Moheibacter sediminis]